MVRMISVPAMRAMAAQYAAASRAFDDLVEVATVSLPTGGGRSPSMQNLEIKLPMPDAERVRAQLERNGATFQWTRRQRDVFYPAPNGWLKLRWEENGRNSLMSYRRR